MVRSIRPAHHRTLALVLLLAALGGCGRREERDAGERAGGGDAPAATTTATSEGETAAARLDREREAALRTGRRAAARGDWAAVGRATEELDQRRDVALRTEARARLAAVVQPLIDGERYREARRELRDGREAFGLRERPAAQRKVVDRALAAEARDRRRARARRERRADRERREASVGERGLRSKGTQDADDLCAQIDETDFAVPPGDPRDPDGDGVACED